MGQVPRLARAAIQRIAGPPLEQPGGQPLGYLQPVKIHQILDQLAMFGQRRLAGADRHQAPVRQHDIEALDMLARGPINLRVGAAGIVGDHPAQRRARTRRHVRPETEPVRPKESV